MLRIRKRLCGTSGKEPACQCRRHKRCGFDPWIGKIPCRRAWQLIPLFLPGESHGQRSLAGYSPWGCRVWHDWRLQKSESLVEFCFGKVQERDWTDADEGREESQGRASAWGSGIFAPTSWTCSTSGVFDMCWYFDVLEHTCRILYSSLCLPQRE